MYIHHHHLTEVTMASRIPTTFLKTTMRPALSPRAVAQRSVSTTAGQQSDRPASFARRVWADPQTRRIAIGVFSVMTCVEGYAAYTYGPGVLASLRGEKE